MRKTSLVLITSLFILLSILINSCKAEINKTSYLRKVLTNLEQIKSASYISTCYASAPGDTLKFKKYYRQTTEYDNPADTTIGSSFVETSQSEGNKTSWTYDGKALSYILWDEKRVRIDSFQTNTLPFRPVTPPFFKQSKTIIKYALETKDSITIDLKDFGDSIKFSLYIPNKVVEFFGKPYVMDNPYLSRDDAFSRYDIWINKSNDLPYELRRNMPHQTTWQTCENIEFNKNKIEDFTAAKYFPPDFAIAIRGKEKPPKNDLVGKVAPDWILKDVNNNSIALKDLSSKVILLKFTGIGCGPCHASVPFLKQLVTENKNKDFELVSIETWSNNIDGIKRYQINNGLNYKFLISTDEVNSSYQVGAVPAFYILDKNRVIRKILVGYGKETTDKEIRDAINELL